MTLFVETVPTRSLRSPWNPKPSPSRRVGCSRLYRPRFDRSSARGTGQSTRASPIGVAAGLWRVRFISRSIRWPGLQFFFSRPVSRSGSRSSSVSRGVIIRWLGDRNRAICVPWYDRKRWAKSLGCQTTGLNLEFQMTSPRGRKKSHLPAFSDCRKPLAAWLFGSLRVSSSMVRF